MVKMSLKLMSSDRDISFMALWSKFGFLGLVCFSNYQAICRETVMGV